MRRTSRRALTIIAVAVAAPDGLAQIFIGQDFAASVRPADNTFRVPDTMGAVGIDQLHRCPGVQRSTQRVRRAGTGASVAERAAHHVAVALSTPSYPPDQGN